MSPSPIARTDLDDWGLDDDGGDSTSSGSESGSERTEAVAEAPRPADAASLARLSLGASSRLKEVIAKGLYGSGAPPPPGHWERPAPAGPAPRRSDLWLEPILEETPLGESQRAYRVLMNLMRDGGGVGSDEEASFASGGGGGSVRSGSSGRSSGSGRWSGGGSSGGEAGDGEIVETGPLTTRRRRFRRCALAGLVVAALALLEGAVAYFAVEEGLASDLVGDAAKHQHRRLPRELDGGRVGAAPAGSNDSARLEQGLRDEAERQQRREFQLERRRKWVARKAKRGRRRITFQGPGEGNYYVRDQALDQALREHRILRDRQHFIHGQRGWNDQQQQQQQAHQHTYGFDGQQQWQPAFQDPQGLDGGHPPLAEDGEGTLAQPQGEAARGYLRVVATLEDHRLEPADDLGGGR